MTTPAHLPTLEFDKFTLDNGLEVILHRNPATPIVCVNLWYHVGSKNEQPGRTGFAHLFEHMMFQGSKHCDREYFQPIQEAGGQANGSTNSDRTNYWEVLPNNYLELALWLEADRMGFLLDAMTQAKLDNQRDVVKNERRQNYENRPYGIARELLVEASFPAGHPYSWTTIGSMSDLSAASLDDVKAFHRTYYTPNNATLVVAGDFEAARARDLVERYFGDIPPGPPIQMMQRYTPCLDADRRLFATDRVELERLFLVWNTPHFFGPGDAAHDVLSALLGQGKSSRLYERMVHRDQIAQDVMVTQLSRELASNLFVVATARDGSTAAELEAVVLEELSRLAVTPPTRAELDRAYNRHEAQAIASLQEIGGFGGVADQLNQYNHYIADPGYLHQDLARWRAVDGAAVRSTAAQLLESHKVALTIAPLRGRTAARKPTPVDRTVQPMPGPTPTARTPKLQRRTLDNGLTLLVAEHHGLPVLELSLAIPAGARFDPAGQRGVASFTASLIDEGTTSRDALTIAKERDGLGASMASFARIDTSGFALGTLTRHAEAALDLFADILIHPTFPVEELERARKQRLTSLIQERSDPTSMSRKAIARLLYGAAHPYGLDLHGTEASVRAITRDSLESFYRSAWRPDTATLIVVGDITADGAADILGRKLGDWKATGTAPQPTLSQPDTAGRAIYLIDRPGAPQSVVAVAQIGMARKDPDYLAATLLNAQLGGMFMSRLNLNLREDKGYTYGARSTFSFWSEPGPFIASAQVQTDVTAAAVHEILLELTEVGGKRPLDPAELTYARNSIVLGMARQFETPGKIADRLRELVLHQLPDDYFDRYIAGLAAVDLDEVNRVARERLSPATAPIIVVGDAATVRPGLEALGVGEIVSLGPDGSRQPQT